MYLAEAANKEAQEFRRKIGASDVQHHHQRHDHELQQQRDVNQVNNRQRDHDRKHGHDQIDIERDIRSSNTSKFVFKCRLFKQSQNTSLINLIL